MFQNQDEGVVLIDLEKMDKSESGEERVKSTVSLSRKMSKVGLLAAMKTFTKPHFQRKKKTKEKAVSRSWDSGLCNVGLTPSPSGGQGGLGTVGSYKRIYWPGQKGCGCQRWSEGSQRGQGGGAQGSIRIATLLTK